MPPSEVPSRLMSPRPRSDAGASGAIVAPRLRMESRAGSTPQRTGGAYMGSVVAAKAAHENAILTAIKRQMEAMEEKLGGQIVRVQQQGDRLRDAAFSRVDAKMGTMEALQPRFDRKLAELSGNYKGLSDEMQAQIRRIDQMDTRLWEWRHQLEDEVRSKFSEVEQAHQQMNSSIRLASATNEDSVKRINNRLKRLETMVEERLGYSDETNQNLVALDVRLQELESSRIQELALCTVDPTPSTIVSQSDAMDNGTGASMIVMEAKLAELQHKLEMTLKDSQEVQTRVEAQEERLRSLRTLMDTKDEHYRNIKFDRQEWESRSKELHSLTQDLEKHRVDHNERLEVYQRRFEHHEKTQEDISDQLRRLQERSYFNLAEATAPPEGDIGLGDTTDGAVANVAAVGFDIASHPLMQDCMARLGNSEQRIDYLDNEFQAIRSDAELAPRVAALVESLKQVAPKVMDQEICVRELHEKVGQLEAKSVLALESEKKSDAITDRIGRLEGDVSRLKNEVEGSEAAEHPRSLGRPLWAHGIPALGRGRPAPRCARAGVVAARGRAKSAGSRLISATNGLDPS
eukprot:CAMPEP_0115616104 /NCGR_PEP_ID=MMETSP0272-20121206/22962_1 /TAXON_ID=71861 /ORGANISM="Scrippsiella trochoidea, Strain CCMP3099" /LENGTH=573 /DNA_ID=CAMNT_0003052029 /DNA_START=112 /DNA_END=1830 /DNA_ORIENTATION=-